MIPKEVQHHVGREVLNVILTAKLTGSTKEENARQLLKTLSPYMKTISQHSLTTLYVDALFKLRQAVRHYGRNKIHLRKDMGKDSPFPLSFDQLTNFSKLRMFGLAVHADPKNPRGGYWLLTSRGSQFLRGETSVPRQVYTFRGHPVPVQPENSLMVRIEDYQKELPQIETFTNEKAEPRANAQLTF